SFVLNLDSEGRMLRVNRSWEGMTGFSLDEVWGKYLWDYLEDKEGARDFLKARQPGKEREDYWLTKRSKPRLVSWCSTVLSDEAGGPEHYVVTGRDITELRQRTEELESFTYSVSHDMRAPVCSPRCFRICSRMRSSLPVTRNLQKLKSGPYRGRPKILISCATTVWVLI